MRTEAASDRQLIERARKGDQAAFGVLVQKYQQKAFAVALGIVRDRDDALDICQEAFLRAYRGLHNFDGNSQIFTWLYRIVHNLAIDHLRRRKLSTVSLDAVVIPLVDASANPERHLLRRKLCASLDEALASLSPVQRAVLLLREVEGLSYKEIAEVTECSIGTVMSRLFHARKRLLKLIEAKEAAPALAAA